MKILHVITSADPKIGGPIEGIRQRAVILREWGHQVEVASADDPAADFVKEFPIPLHALGPGQSGFARAPRMLKWLREHAHEYDVLIANGIWQYPNGALRKAARAAKKPYWVFTHGMLDPYFNRAYPLKRLKKKLFWAWQHAVLRDAKAVLFTCEDERLLARESFQPYRVKERVVSYGTSRPPSDPEGKQTAAFLDAFPQLRGRRYLLFLSRLHPKKGCDLLLRAFGAVAKDDPDLMLVMAGPVDEAYGAELKKIAADAGIADRVVWTGMVKGDIKYGAFRAAEAFALPSHQENFGIAVAEALACGLPVLISHQVNIWREIEADGAAIVENDDQAGVDTLLRRWIATPIERRKQMAERALACYEARYTVEESARSLIEAVTSEP